jgi:hypothetical protein
MAELLYGDPPDLRRMASDLSLPSFLVRGIVDDGAVLGELPRSGPVEEPSTQVSDDQEVNNVRDLTEHRERQRGTD